MILRESFELYEFLGSEALADKIRIERMTCSIILERIFFGVRNREEYLGNILKCVHSLDKRRAELIIGSRCFDEFDTLLVPGNIYISSRKFIISGKIMFDVHSDIVDEIFS